MTVIVRINDTLYKQAKAEAKVEQRTIAGQIEQWALVGRAALAKPDLLVTFVAECLAALSESNEKLQPFVLGCKN